MSSRGDTVPPPRPSISRIAGLSPRSRYRLVRDTLGFGELVRGSGNRPRRVPSGDTERSGAGSRGVSPSDDEIRRFFRDAYLVRFLRELKDILDRSGAAACRHAVEQVIAIGNAAASVTSDGSGESVAPPDPADVGRRAAALLECLARLAGESTDEPMDVFADEPVEPRRDERSGASDTGDAADGSSDAVPAWDTVVLPVVIYLPHVRSPYNLGGIIRTAAAFGIAGVVCGPDSPSFDHPRVRRAAMGTVDTLPVLRGGWSRVDDLVQERLPHAPGSLPLFAVETGGTPITEATIPANSVLIFGHEEFGVPREELKRCEESGGVVTIPHGGTKGSLNVGVSVGIALAWIDQGLSSIR